MFAPDPKLALRFLQEGNGTRVAGGRLNLLFPNSRVDDVEQTFVRLFGDTHQHFAPRWKAYTGPRIPEGDFHALLQEITLHWMYFRHINDLPMKVDTAGWNHPQTLRIIDSAVNRSLQIGTHEKTLLSCHLMAISEEEYQRWREADDAFQEVM